MPLVKRDGIELHYRIDGHDGLPWLVLSSGLGTDLSMWDPQLPALARDYRVLRYDHRGHGRSSTPAGSFSIEHLAGDVLTLIDSLGIECMHFCGLSMGGMVGMWLGAHAPRRLNALVLAHTAARIGPPAIWNERIGIVAAKGMGAISDAAITRWFTPAYIAREASTVARMKAAMERVSVEGYIRCCEAVRDADYRELIASIKCPTLVIAGAHDPATPPADGKLLVQRIAGAHWIELDAAHLSNIESPQAFNAALLSFLASTLLENPRHAASR